MPLTDFHPAIAEWFARTLGEPSAPQRLGWPLIQAGKHVLIASPTGSGKTLAAFLWAINQLYREGSILPDETRVLYISPLKALSNDVKKNLERPLEEIRNTNVFVPDVRVFVRTGDTLPGDRAKMGRKPPHILVTTPESLYILLTTASGRGMLRTVRTVIVDEIHALVRDKRGAHLALSLERLEQLAGSVQRIGLSATQKPLADIGQFLVGVGRECELVDIGHRRNWDIEIELPQTPLESVCSDETWGEIYQRISELIESHRTTLIFVNTRKMAERIAARLTELLGEEAVTCHHGSLSRKTRLDAEARLKEGKLRALVATASLELGIDIGEVDLVIQVGASRSIATFLQRIGRAGHSLTGVPKGRVFPLTIDELVEAAALVRAVNRGVLDRTPQSRSPLDILAQQIVACCVAEEWTETALYQTLRRAWPYRELTQEKFNTVVQLHTRGKAGLLHRDGVWGRLLARRRARVVAVTCGGAIPDVADYSVLAEPDGTFVGTLNEDFAIESNIGDIFQLGNTSWRVLRVEGGIVRVVDAKGEPPSIPFWLGEAPSRTAELSAEIAELRENATLEMLRDECHLSTIGAEQVVRYLGEGRRILGAVPTQERIILERFFDESGGMQLVIHAPFGGRINRAWGLALRKRFCRGFGFELQAAANEEAIIISLGTQHSFPLAEVFDYLSPTTVREVLIQALLDAPMFEARWRWNATRSLVLERQRGGKRVPAPLLRMRATDLLAHAFPEAIACPETLPGGDIPVPMDHPLVGQTVEDCLYEAMDVDGFLNVISAITERRIEGVAIDTTQPSSFARGILASQPYTFLDDAPLEERRTQAVLNRRAIDSRSADELGALSPNAIAQVREEAWPRPESMEEVHEALCWMGYVTAREAESWKDWIKELDQSGRVTRENGIWLANDSTRDPLEILKGRLEALGPVSEDDPRIADCARNGASIEMLLQKLENSGAILRTRIDSQPVWCERRLLARIHRYTLEQLRREIEPVSVSVLLQFLASWQHVSPGSQLEGPLGVKTVLTQLSGFQLPASAWESSVLPLRVRDYRREWLDELTLQGEFGWGRLWGAGASPIRSTPIAFFPRSDLERWLELTQASGTVELRHPAKAVFETLATRGPMFATDLRRVTNLLPSHIELGLAELVARGIVSCDSFAGLRELVIPSWKRRRAPAQSSSRAIGQGRWCLFRSEASHPIDERDDELSQFVARRLLERTGLVFRRIVVRERQPLPWYSILRALRRMELRGEVRGGRFVAGFPGEQYALPEAVERLRRHRGRAMTDPVQLKAADPLNFVGILTSEPRVSSNRSSFVSLAP